MQSIWQVALIALAAGGLIGALAYRLLAPSLTRAGQVRAELEAARQELIDYKASVNSHFDKTSELVSDLTQNYVKVYQHLAEGAQTLGGSRQLNNLLEQQQGKVLLTVDDQTEFAHTPAVASNVELSAASQAAGESPRQGEELPVAAAGGTEGAQAVADDSNVESAAPPRATAASADEGGEALSAAIGDQPGTTHSPGSEGDSESSAAGEPLLDVGKIRPAGTSETVSSLKAAVPEHEVLHEKAAPTRH